MILLGILLLFGIPTLWGLLVAVREVFVWREDKVIARKLSLKFGRDVDEGGPLGPQVKNAFNNAFWAVFQGLLFIGLLGILLYSCFGED
jgi:hypothetical protein